MISSLIRFSAVALLVSLLPFNLCAADSNTAAIPVSADMSALSWMEGDWCGTRGERQIEEHWLPPVGGQLLGISRTIKGDKVGMFEFLRIDMIDNVPTYLAQPGGSPPTAFSRVMGGEGWVRFANPEHDFPQTIEYRREGNELHASIAGPGKDGKLVQVVFQYASCEKAAQ